jgi:glycosyltransferase involved in cell wall biosynthesis
MWVSRRESTDESVIEHPLRKRFLGRSRLQLRRGWIALTKTGEVWRFGRRGFSLLTDDRSPYGASVAGSMPAADVIHLHHAAPFLDWRPFFRAVGGRVPLVLTLHDMHPFTGGCRYTKGCGRFTGSCGKCPLLKSARVNDLSQAIWRRKQQALSCLQAQDLHVVAPSSWLAAEAKKSSLLGRFPISLIPYGVQTDIFKPVAKAIARERLHIHPKSRVVLFVAASLSDPRKGFHFLSEALGLLPASNDTLLLTAGSGAPRESVPCQQKHLGVLEDNESLVLAYSAADVFVIPAIEDNLPNTVLEALACGTPTIGFSVGGIPDMVREGVTGWLVPVQDRVALATALGSLLEKQELRAAFSMNARKIALSEYDLKIQARHYASLYSSAVERAVAG